TGVLAAQEKTGKGDKTGTGDGIKARVDKVDHDKKTISVTTSGGKKLDLSVTKDTKFYGPRKGKSRFKDKRLKAGIEVTIVYDGKTLKSLTLPSTKRKPKDKGKTKDKKDKKKGKKDKDKEKDKDKDDI